MFLFKGRNAGEGWAFVVSQGSITNEATFFLALLKLRFSSNCCFNFAYHEECHLQLLA